MIGVRRDLREVATRSARYAAQAAEVAGLSVDVVTVLLLALVLAILGRHRPEERR